MVFAHDLGHEVATADLVVGPQLDRDPGTHEIDGVADPIGLRRQRDDHHKRNERASYAIACRPAAAYSPRCESGRSLLVGTIITLVILAAIVWYAISMYNNLVNSRNRVGNAFSQIDVQLTRRYDLIPNLVEAVKGYMGHERGTLEAVINARNAASAGLKKAAANPSDPSAIKELAAAEATLGGTLGRLFALAEAYPDLKANQNMQQLQEELTSTENKVAFARQAFNDAVLATTMPARTFPAT